MRPFLTTTIAAIGLMTASCAEAGPTTTMSKAEIETLVKEYILENPEIIRDAIIKLQEKEAVQEQEIYRESIVSAKDALENDPRDPAIGPADAKVTIVEFFDYNCGFCKRATPWVEEAAKKYGDDVRVVFKELPILDDRTKTSRLASRAALAAMKYDMDEGREIMAQENLITVMLVHAENNQMFHSRNPFAIGGVYEDPATGAASAAFGGYLNSLNWPHQGEINILQGEDMGMPSKINVKISGPSGSPVFVGGQARFMESGA